ncbi:MAG: DUF4097 family beta strand repeat-containing protein [Clostridia bacterium]|nr:DUF4097 family beta strand repeat-containing protein [Clostridia bacterium]
MKKLFKIIGLIAVVFMFSGIACISTALVLGADVGAMFSEARDAVRGVSGGIIAPPLGIDIWSEEVESINISGGGCAVTIRMGEEFAVEKSDNVEITEEIINGVLHVTTSKKLSLADFSSGSIKITIPQGFVAKNADISIDSGSLSIKNLYADNLNVEVGAGECKITKSYSQESSFTVSMGKLEAEGDFGHCSVDVGMGSADIETVGRYSVEYTCGLGKIEIDDYDVARGGGSGTYGTGERKMVLNCGVGEIEVEFEKEK